MTDVHTLYLAALVSQATFALTLTLLAWSDRRTRGILWMAGACALQFCWTATRGAAVHPSSRSTEGMAAALVVLLFSMLYMGFRWFSVRRGLTSMTGPLVIAAVLVLIAGLSPLQPQAAALVGRLTAFVLCAMTIRMLWSTPVRELRTQSRVCAGLLATVITIMLVRMVTQQPFEKWSGDGHEPPMMVAARILTVIAVTLLSFSFITLYVAEANRRLQEETRTDLLTGLRNRRAMEEAAAREVGLAVQNGTSLALLMMDLDRFKLLNDTFGHALGDRALRTLGAVLMAGTGARDCTARMGGEEFAVLLPGMEIEAAALIADRLRRVVEGLRLSEEAKAGVDREASVTVSIGVSVLRNGETSWSEMLCRADDALYQAKRDGRNRVAMCTLGPSPMTPEREAGRRAWRGSRWLPKPGPML